MQQYYCYDINVITCFQQEILFSHDSIGDPLRKREFLEQNGKVVTDEAIDSFPKTDILIRIGLPNPLGDTPKYIERP